MQLFEIPRAKKSCSGRKRKKEKAVVVVVGLKFPPKKKKKKQDWLIHPYQLSSVFSNHLYVRTTFILPEKCNPRRCSGYIQNGLILPIRIETRERGYDCYFLGIRGSPLGLA